MTEYTKIFNDKLACLKNGGHIKGHSQNGSHRMGHLETARVRTAFDLMDQGFHVTTYGGIDRMVYIDMATWYRDIEDIPTAADCIRAANAKVLWKHEPFREWLDFHDAEDVSVKCPTSFNRALRQGNKVCEEICALVNSLHTYAVLCDMELGRIEHEYQEHQWKDNGERDLRRKIDCELRDGIDIDDVPFDWAKLRELCEWEDDSFDLEKAVEFAIDFYKGWLERIRPDAERVEGSTELVLRIRELINNCNAAWPCEREEALDSIFELLKAN